MRIVFVPRCEITDCDGTCGRERESKTDHDHEVPHIIFYANLISFWCFSVRYRHSKVMVNMNDVEMESPLEKSKKEALQLSNEKRRLEDELKEWLSILTQNNVGMDDALIDTEGYPRSDIDVYQVRGARNRIICIRNDLKNLMKRIEELLHIIHSEDSGSSQSGLSEESVYGLPIAKVTSVSPSSPADEAGLKAGDTILTFGSVCEDNFSSIADIANIVKHSINELIKVVVQRDEKIRKLYLKPHLWSGPGVLGCMILPHEQVER